jgi:Mg2+ and Co2+ transporter CorA
MWRGRLRRRKGHFFTFTDIVPQTDVRARTQSDELNVSAVHGSQAFQVPAATFLRLQPDLVAGVDTVYQSDDELDSDGISAAEAEQLLGRAHEIAHKGADMYQQSLRSTRFVLDESEGEDATPTFLLSPASPTLLLTSSRQSDSLGAHGVTSTNVFAEIVAVAGQHMADAVQQRLMALQKRVIELHSTLDHEMKARKRFQGEADKLGAQLQQTKAKFTDTIRSHDQQIVVMMRDTHSRVEVAENAAAQAAADLKRVTNAAYLLHSAADHRIEHLERVIVDLQNEREAAGSPVRLHSTVTQKDAGLYMTALSAPATEAANPNEAGIAQNFTSIQEHERASPRESILEQIPGRRPNAGHAPPIPTAVLPD